MADLHSSTCAFLRSAQRSDEQILYTRLMPTRRRLPALWRREWRNLRRLPDFPRKSTRPILFGTPPCDLAPCTLIVGDQMGPVKETVVPNALVKHHGAIYGFAVLSIVVPAQLSVQRGSAIVSAPSERALSRHLLCPHYSAKWRRGLLGRNFRPPALAGADQIAKPAAARSWGMRVECNQASRLSLGGHVTSSAKFPSLDA